MKLVDYFTQVMTESHLWSHPRLPFKARVHEGHPKLAVVTGENGTGKSLLVQLLCSWCRVHEEIQNISVSIRERTGSGLYDMAGMRRAMMFGDETEESTGAISIRVLEPAFNTLASRSKENQSTVLVLDEPELGLSDGFANAMGVYLARKTKALPALAVGLVVVTHSRPLVRGLIDELEETPTFIKLGVEQDLSTWLKGEAPKSLKELEALPFECRKKQHIIREIISEAKR